MNIIIDALIIAIAVGCTVMGYRLGIVKMMVSFLKNIVAIAVASLYSSRLGAYLYGKVFKGVFESMTAKKITEWLGIDASSAPDIGPLLEEKHSEFMAFIDKLGISTDSVTEKYEELGEGAGDAMVEFIAKPIGTAVANVVAFIAIFIATALVIQIAGFIVGKIVKLPVLNVTNKFLGLILGALLGIVFVFLFVSLVSVVAPYIKVNGDYLTVGALEEGTIIYKYLATQTPSGLITTILQKIGVK